MVVDFVSADFGWLQSPDGKKSARWLFKPGTNCNGYFTNDDIQEQGTGCNGHPAGVLSSV
ncbi:hypothetical protein BYT27DRAFT_7114152 [Phlegmacium glaucopus]|nr:hypothetical protein BYT27DRAFT_7114152 [Phlegmacium glaucopus]